MNENVIECISRGVLVRDGKVLLCKPKSGKYTYLPGGHIEFGETSRQALVREIQEELGMDMKAGELLGVHENSFVQDGQPHCEINLIYRLECDATMASPASQEDWIEFEWRDITDLGNANLLPREMAQYVG